VAALVGAEPRNVVFTSGGTEANMLALCPGLTEAGCERLLVSGIEHPSVLAGGRFPAAAREEVAATAAGQIDLAVLRARLAAPGAGRPLVSLMLANNETGVVQPVGEAACLVHEAGGLLHVDAVQAAGKIPCDIKALGADLLTISGHKIGAAKGVGALIRRDETLHIAEPLIRGGGQERGARGGTENVVGIAGFGAAAAAAQADLARAAAHMQALRQRLEAELKASRPDLIVFGSETERLPNTTLFSVSGMKAETAVIAFDLEGIAVSAGAACSSGKVQASHVLGAMGVSPELARGAVRVSLGPTTTEAAIERFLDAWIKVAGALLKTQGGLAA
jgi:cysteine desulfurase